MTRDSSSLFAQESSTAQAGEDQQLQLANRFYELLLRNPRRGTTFDRVYGHHLEAGTLDTLVEKLQEAANRDRTDGSHGLVLGLLASHRGLHEDAITAYQNALSLRPKDPMVYFYMGQSYLQLGEEEKGVAALESAITAMPNRADLMEVFQLLGKVHQRARRTEQALGVWRRFEEAFPNDLRVQEQIASILLEEGAASEAIVRYEKLASSTQDDYKRSQYRILAAELKIQSQQREQGIAELENVLSDLNPTSWLYRDVQKKLEQVFLRSGDQDGLVRYYEGWLAKHPDDIDGMIRLANYLSESGRSSEGMAWIEQGIQRAPNRSDLLRSYIALLVEQKNYVAADKQFEKLSQLAPENTDTFRDWGRVVLLNKEMPQRARFDRADSIWSRMLDNHEKDPVIHAQVADLFRQAGNEERAIELYEAAIRLAPRESQYKEYLGEFYHKIHQDDKALATWALIVAGENRTADHLVRLAEIYQNFGYPEKALQEIRAAIELSPNELTLQTQCADYWTRLGKYPEALVCLDAAAALASNQDQSMQVLRQRIEVLQLGQSLEAEVEAIQKKIAIKPNRDDWLALACYFEALRELPKAIECVEEATRIAPGDLTAIALQARLYESSNDLMKAVEIYRSLTNLDRRARDEYLKKIALMELDLGRGVQAVETANALIALSPTNLENYQFLSRICFQLGLESDGIQALRKAVQISPNEPSLSLALANALAERLQAQEAIDIYWKTMNQSEEVDDKTLIVQKLVPLYLQLEQFDQLIEKLTEQGNDEHKQRTMTICIAQAYQTSGDLRSAKEVLERLLRENTRDTNLLQQLSRLCAEAGNLGQAIVYQRELVSIAPGPETELPLGEWLAEAGELTEARSIAVQNLSREEDGVRLLSSLDSLTSKGQFEVVIDVTRFLLLKEPLDWELRYRQAVALQFLDRKEEASREFEALLKLKLPDRMLSKSADEKYRRAELNATSGAKRGSQFVTADIRPTEYSLVDEIDIVRYVTTLSSEDWGLRGVTANSRQTWFPQSFGAAKIASQAWLMANQRDANQNDDWFALTENALEERLKNSELDRGELLDCLYLATLLTRHDLRLQIAKHLASRGSLLDQEFFLKSLLFRRSGNLYGEEDHDNPFSYSGLSPLSDADLDLVVACFEQLMHSRQKENFREGPSRVYFYRGSVYRYGSAALTPLNSLPPVELLPAVVRELKLGGRSENIDQIIEAFLKQATRSSELMGVFSILLELNSRDRLDELFDRWHTLAAQEMQSTIASKNQGKVFPFEDGDADVILSQWMGRLADEKNFTKMLEILGRSIDILEWEFEARRADRARQFSKKPTLAIESTSEEQLVSSTFYSQGSERSEWISMPLLSAELSSSQIQLIGQAYKSLELNQREGMLLKVLTQRAEQSDMSNGLSRSFALSTFYRFSGERDADINSMLIAIRKYADHEIQFMTSRVQMLLRKGSIREAIQVLDNVPMRNANLLKERELAVLKLTERIGEFDRARLAVKRLFGLRLNSAEKSEIIPVLLRMGLHDKADALKTASKSPRSQSAIYWVEQMKGKEAERNVTAAKQIAQKILQQTVSHYGAYTSANLNHAHSGHFSEDAYSRNQAIAYLDLIKELNPMIERLESQCTQDPSSSRLLEQLVELYLTTERESRSTSKAVECILRYLAVKPDAMGWRCKLAELYIELKQPSFACDQYLYVIAKKPKLLIDNLKELLVPFEEADRSKDLIAALEQVDLRSLDHPYYFFHFLSALLSRTEDCPLTATLIERSLKCYPVYQNTILAEPKTELVLGYARSIAISKELVIPQNNSGEFSEWHGLTSIEGYAESGQVQTRFGALLRLLKTKVSLRKFLSEVQDASQRLPNWKAAKPILALLWVELDNVEEATRILEKECEESSLKNYPRTAAWIVGAQLRDAQPLRPYALKFLRHASEATTDLEDYTLGTTNGVQEIFVDVLLEEGFKDEAKKHLMNALGNSSSVLNSDPYFDPYFAALNFQKRIASLEKLITAGFQPEAVVACSHLLIEHTAIENAIQGQDEEFKKCKNQIRTLLKKALQSIDTDQCATLAKLAIPTPDEFASTKTCYSLAQDLIVHFSPAPESIPSPVSSRNLDALEFMAGSPIAMQAMIDRAKELADQFPGHLYYPIVLCVLELQGQGTGVESTLARLDGVLDLNPLQIPAPNELVYSDRNRDCAIRTSLWKIANTLFERNEYLEFANRFAQESLEAGKALPTPNVADAIFDRWAFHALESGDVARAEKIWNEWMNELDTRPLSKHNHDSDNTHGSMMISHSVYANSSLFPMEAGSQTEASVDAVASLLRISRHAARLGLAQTSMRAFRIALRDGLEHCETQGNIQEANTSFPSSLSTLFLESFSFFGVELSPQQDVPARTNPALRTSFEIASEWKRKKMSAEGIYATLDSVVFPPNLPDIIRISADPEVVEQAGESLAAILVRLAIASEHTESLKAKLEFYESNANTRIEAICMQLLLSMETRDDEFSKACLKRLEGFCEKRLHQRQARAIRYAATMASRISHLQATATHLLSQVTVMEE